MEQVQGKRKYQEVWEKLIANPGQSVKIQVRKLELMRRVRKAVWKEKDLDRDNRGKWRLNCVMDETKGVMEFTLQRVLESGDV